MTLDDIIDTGPCNKKYSQLVFLSLFTAKPC